ncbi:MAG: tRNA (mnm(5)s(2)U34)-methyltransferase [Candidatus Fimivivens sp.]
MIGILQLAKNRLSETANPHGIYVDFTMGRGRDTLFLCQLAPQGKIYAFDVQQSALDQTAELLLKNSIDNAALILDSHERFTDYVPSEIDGGLFNLGFLPGGDPNVTTQRGSTAAAVRLAMRALKHGGALGVAVYPGHEEGRLEGESLQSYFADIDKKEFDIFIYRLLNIADAPYMMIIERH